MRSTAAVTDRWLLLQFVLPPGKSSARVAAWRRLRALGALPLGGGTYVLAEEAENRESFEWLRRDILGLGGEALLFAAQPVDSAASAALARRRAGESTGGADAAPGGGLEPLDRAKFRGRIWITRPRPGVDRMASAWLLRHFIDPQARFRFAEAPEAGSSKEIPFDTFGAEFGHQNGLCTFEVLARRFAIVDSRVAALARTVHAIDLHEPGADPAEAALVARLVEGLRASQADDSALLEAGVAVFAALFASLPAPPASSRRRLSRPRKERKR